MALSVSDLTDSPSFVPTLRDQVIEMLKTCYDPEIPFNVVDLGLIYSLTLSHAGVLSLKMTLTSPGCPVGPWLTDEIKRTCQSIHGITKVDIEITFDPPWNPSMMSESAHKSLGF